MTTISGDVEIERFSEQDIERLVALTAASFGRRETTEYYRWKYVENPEGPVTAYVARARDTSLAAFYGVIPEAYYVRGRRVRMHQSCDTMTHPDFRRRGLFERLATRTYDDLASRDEDLVKGFAGEMSVSGFVKKLGWQLIERIKPRFMVRWQMSLVSLWHRSPDLLFRVVENDGLSERLDGFDTVAANTYPIWKARDQAYLTWRVRDPHRKHQLLSCFVGERLAGYCLYCVEDSLLLIRDLVWEQGREIIADHLVRGAQSVALRRGLRGVYSWTNRGSVQDQLLARLGFIRNPFDRGPMVTPLYFIIRANSQIVPRDFMLRSANWNLLPIEYDF